MDSEKVKIWIKKKLKENPKLADEYKQQMLDCQEARLKWFERMFEREQYTTYHDPSIMLDITKLYDFISHLKNIESQNLLYDEFLNKFVSNRYNLKVVKRIIELLNNMDDEDHYISGVFQCTEYSYIRNKDDYQHQLDNGGKIKRKIERLYKSGLGRRDEFVKSGLEMHQKLLAEFMQDAKQCEEIENAKSVDEIGDSVIQQLIDKEILNKKVYLRNLAQINVFDAFDRLGAHPEPKEAEKIDKIIEMHEPSIVNDALVMLLRNPSANILALAEFTKQNSERTRFELNVYKAMDYIALAAGSVAMALGIVQTAGGNTSLLTLALGAGGIASGISGLFEHNIKLNNLNDRQELMDKCIQDLLIEVELLEAFEPEK